jgi:carboxyl-terminal processing protease
VVEGGIGLIRVVRVADGLAAAIKETLAGFGGAAKLKGVVLDLRYTGGEDYAAAAAAGDLYVPKERVMLDWGTGPVSSKEKDDAITTPTVVLVNGQTSGAAEALAAVLREMGSALIVGKRTAGKAMMAQEYPLKDGSKLRIATGSVKVGENTSLTSQGITPDIEVDVPAQSERAYYLNPFYGSGQSGSIAANTGAGTGTGRTGSGGTTNRPARRPRLTEAELVREKQTGTGRDTAPVEAETEGPVVRDPSLARALDLLKGLAVVRSQRP